MLRTIRGNAYCREGAGRRHTVGTLRILGQLQPEDAWLHRFRNFGEDVYVQLRERCDVSIEEIDAAFDTFYIKGVAAGEAAAVTATLDHILREHHLEDSVCVLPQDQSSSGGTVVLVLDTAFGDRLWQVAWRHDTWVVPSDINRLVVEEMWRERADRTGEPSLTMWSARTTAVTEGDWLAILETIEIHHGAFACEPPVGILSVYGAALTSAVATALEAYEYDLVRPTRTGFLALKRTTA